jgi:hypothetical protein
LPTGSGTSSAGAAADGETSVAAESAGRVLAAAFVLLLFLPPGTEAPRAGTAADGGASVAGESSGTAADGGAAVAGESSGSFSAAVAMVLPFVGPFDCPFGDEAK